MDGIGLQLYTVRKYFENSEDTGKLFEELKKIGYEEAELFGNIDVMEPQAEATQKANMPIAGTISNIKAYSDIDKTVEFCKRFGIRNLGISASPFEGLSEVDMFIRQVNVLADKFSSFGIKLSYHNHSHEFIRMENGKTAYEMLVNECDGIGFVPDVYWLQHGGADIRRWIDILGDRIVTLHLKDMIRTPDGITYAPVGEGNLWWRGILDEAYKHNVEHYIVEQDVCSKEPIECIKSSIEFLKKL